MTYNQVISRLRILALSHRQINDFFAGDVLDFLNEEQTYPACVVSNRPFTIDAANKVFTLGFRIYLIDLVDISTNARRNEPEVVSDMLSVMADLKAMIGSPQFDDWTLNDLNQGEILTEQLEDYVAGPYMDIDISIDFLSDTCQVPSDEIIIPNTDDMKYVYDVTYIASGDEGSELDTSAISELGVLTGKRILLVTREYSVLYKAQAPASIQSTEYAWDNNTNTDNRLRVVELGLPTLPGERFHFLYRSY